MDMLCSPSSFSLPVMKMHSVLTYACWQLSANGSDTFLDEIVKYKCIWIFKVLHHTALSLWDSGCISPDFFKLRGESFPASLVLSQSYSQTQTGSAHAPSHSCPSYTTRNDQQPSTRRELPESGMHKPCLLHMGWWEPVLGNVRLESRRGAYMVWHSAVQAAWRGPTRVNLNTYQQWMASESNHLFFWKYPTNLF